LEGNKADGSWATRAPVRSAMTWLRISLVVDMGMGTWWGDQATVSGWTNLVGPPIDAGVALVALKVMTNIPAIDSGRGPSGALAGLLMHHHMCSKRGNGVSIVIIGSIQAGPCGMFGVEAQGSK